MAVIESIVNSQLSSTSNEYVDKRQSVEAVSYGTCCIRRHIICEVHVQSVRMNCSRSTCPYLQRKELGYPASRSDSIVRSNEIFGKDREDKDIPGRIEGLVGRGEACRTDMCRRV